MRCGAFARKLAELSNNNEQDPPQSGYLPNHNIDPSRLSNWTISWSNNYNPKEVFYAKPLVFTPRGCEHELVILASNQNNVRVVDGLNGTLIQSRTLDPPFSSIDSNCTDLPDTIGITGTPIIDPKTETLYLFAKSYINGRGGPQGTIQGANHPPT
jgi:hypothetical protein